MTALNLNKDLENYPLAKGGLTNKCQLELSKWTS